MHTSSICKNKLHDLVLNELTVTRLMGTGIS